MRTYPTESQRIAGSEIRVGTELAAADGYLFTVRRVVRETPKTITVVVASGFSPMREIRDGVEKTFRKSSVFRGFQPEAQP